MAKFHDALDDKLQAFMAAQHIFFVATAPREGRVNVSPKGMDSFRCLDPRTVAYLDVTGSGNETAAHLLDNGRLTLMFCSFDKEPLILRLYGTGRVVRPRDEDWARLFPLFQPLPGARQIMLMAVTAVQTSCGFAVPRYDFRGERDTLRAWAEKKGAAGVRQYWIENNQTSIDGLPSGLLEDSADPPKRPG
ncbi:MAG TPA: pyridoxamine 5'-phosphate oxidase family protein [Gammaproteobacteria bacterium]|nr:pyridoxamine 5'-phosphate oxidase family protein [Gammaproteobacteria bacterium]